MMHVALLRGVNVGGKNRLPMKHLARMFEAAGCTDVRTYIQSGNVVFAASATVAARVPRTIAAALQAELELVTPVVTRTSAELARTVANNPFDASAHVMFLADRPAPHLVAALDSNRSPGDRFLVRGRDVYLHVPTGMARTKLTNAYFDRALATVSTVRNWRTVLALVELAGG